MARHPRPLEADLANYLHRHVPLGSTEAVWLGGALPLRATSYLGVEPPPLAYVNSARAIVFRGPEVLVIRGARGDDDLHIVPGGRREGDETPIAALRREVLEETGWTVAREAPLGFVHFHILARPPAYPYPHSGFLNVIYTAEAVSHHPAALLPGDVEVGLGFWPLAEVLALPLSADERLFLDAALARRRDQ